MRLDVVLPFQGCNTVKRWHFWNVAVMLYSLTWLVIMSMLLMTADSQSLVLKYEKTVPLSDWVLLYNIRKIRAYLSEHAAHLLLQARATSHLDCCGSSLAGLPAGLARASAGDPEHTTGPKTAHCSNPCCSNRIQVLDAGLQSNNHLLTSWTECTLWTLYILSLHCLAAPLSFGPESELSRTWCRCFLLKRSCWCIKISYVHLPNVNWKLENTNIHARYQSISSVISQ